MTVDGAGGLGPGVVREYLERIGVDAARPRPGADLLAAVHRAHLRTVPYENLDIQLGHPVSLRPDDLVDKIVRRRRGGYCFELNTCFSLLLRALGFPVRIVAAAIARPSLGEAAWGNHMALLVEADGRRWLSDVGLGDGFLEPLPLVEGRHRQGPFEFGLSRHDDVWRMAHHPGGSVDGFEFRTSPRSVADFAAQNARLSRSPDSPFVQVLIAQRPDTDHSLTLRGLTLTLLGAAGDRHVRTLERETEFAEVLGAEFGIGLDGLAGRDVAALWRRAYRQHLAWSAA